MSLKDGVLSDVCSETDILCAKIDSMADLVGNLKTGYTSLLPADRNALLSVMKAHLLDARSRLDVVLAKAERALWETSVSPPKSEPV